MNNRIGDIVFTIIALLVIAWLVYFVKFTIAQLVA